MKALFLRNPGYKALALALSIFLWFSVSGRRRQRVSERGYAVGLTVVNLPADRSIVSPIPDSIDVRLKGPFNSIRLAEASKMEAVMDLSGAIPGESIYKLSADDINAPEELEVISISPSSVRLKIERVVDRQVPIAVRYSGALRSVTAIVYPARARVIGPASLVDRLESISTEPVSLAGRSGDFATSAPLSTEPGIRVVEPKGPVSVHIHWNSPR
jgi:YbbR domain-containing protein